MLGNSQRSASAFTLQCSIEMMVLLRHPEPWHSAPFHSSEAIMLKPDNKVSFWKNNKYKTLRQYAHFRRGLRADRGWREIKATQSFLLNVPRLSLNGFEGRFSPETFSSWGWGRLQKPKGSQQFLEDSSNLLGTSQSEKELQTEWDWLEEGRKQSKNRLSGKSGPCPEVYQSRP